ncbi:MAG: hypothetical protein HYS18_13120 [Burkholderiales bacterium]|nr:hypothetical protein [Burkholderiales bacterium]
MQHFFSSDELIEALIDSHCGAETSREKHLLRECLRNLVRLAKVEQTESMLTQTRWEFPTQGESVLH